MTCLQTLLEFARNFGPKFLHQVADKYLSRGGLVGASAMGTREGKYRVDTFQRERILPTGRVPAGGLSRGHLPVPRSVEQRGWTSQLESCFLASIDRAAMAERMDLPGCDRLRIY